MNRKLVKPIIVTVCCMMLTLAGCADTPTVEESTSATQTTTEAPTTEAPTTEAPTTEAPTTEAPTTEAPTTETPTTEVPTVEKTTEVMSLDDALVKLKEAGIIAANPDSITAVPENTKANVEIEKIEAFGGHFIVVTLNSRLSKVDASDITFKKYNTDWYALSATNEPMTVTNSFSAVNNEGKTVIIYEVAEKLDGTRVAADTSEKKFSNLAAEVLKADNYITWQMDHGGWDKDPDGHAKRAWDGVEKKNKKSNWFAKNGEMLGTIDNDATYTHMRHIAAVYREVPDEKYKESVLKGLDFIFKLQYESGGFAQVYPERGNYSDNATFNDDAMINVLIMLEAMRDKAYPFDSDIIPEDYIVKIEDSIDRAIDFILKSQIVSNGKLTAWCAQHDPVTYAPVGARSYELASISGSESVGIIKFLMHQEQTSEIKTAVESAIQWMKESEIKNTKYIKNDPNGVYFVEAEGSSLWYRFYEIDTNLPIFCDRDGIPKHSITEIGEERRNGYSWSGTYPKKLLEIYDTYGYYAGRIEAVVTGTSSVTTDNKTLAKEAVIIVESEIAEKK